MRKIRRASVHQLHIFAGEERFKTRRLTFASTVVCCACRANASEPVQGKRARIGGGDVAIGKCVHVAYHPVSGEADT